MGWGGWDGVDQLITLSTATWVEVELGLGCGWAVTILDSIRSITLNYLETT